MSTSWPTGIDSYGYTPAAGKAVPFDVFQKILDGIIGMQTSFINGQYRASVYNSAAVSLANNTATAMAFDSEDFDVGAMHDPVTNNSRVTIPSGAGGVYLVIGTTTFASNTTGDRILDIYKNGAAQKTESQRVVSGAITHSMSITAILSLAAADYVQMTATQTSGGALNAGSATRANASALQVIRIW